MLNNMNIPPGMEGSSFMDPAMIVGLRPPQMTTQQMMEVPNRSPADRILLEQQWKDPRFFPITIETVMQYFCQRDNIFFDTNSDNALIMMQNPGVSSGPILDDKLKLMNGIQFVLVQPPSSAPLFVIRKQQRMSADRITPLCHYYVLDGVVYQAPDLHTFLNSRLVGIMDPLRNAFSEAVEMLRFTPSKGYFWEFKTKPSKKAEDEGSSEEMETDYMPQQIGQQKEKKEDPLSIRATPYQRLRTDMLLQELAAEFTINSSVSIDERETQDG